MAPADLKIATRSAIGAALLAAGVLLLSGGGLGAYGSPRAAAAAQAPNPEFLHSAAAIDGRLQMLREFEKRMVAHAEEAPHKAAEYRTRREATRRRIDELMLVAVAAAGSEEERRRLAGLATMARIADARLARIDGSIFQPKGDR
jgi:hypothetical protein